MINCLHQLKMSRNEDRVYLIIALLIFGLIMAEIFGEHLNNQLHAEASRTAAENKLGNIRNRLEVNLRGDIQLVKGLVSLIATHPKLSQEEFSRAAKPMFEGGSLLRNIGAAPDLVIRMMYPIAGNEKAIGLDYRTRLNQIETAERVRATGQMILAGPIQLVQGGTGLIGEIPVFTESSDGHKKFWGLTSAVIDVDKLYRSSGLLDPNITLEIAIRGKDGKGAQGELFFGQPDTFKNNPVVADVALPNGSWVIAAVPRGGWVTQADNTWELRLAFLLISLLILWPFYALARSLGSLERAQRQIESERNALQQSKEQLAAILNASMESIILIDVADKVLTLNDTAAKRFNKDPSDMLGRCVFDFLPSEVMVARREHIEQVFRTGKAISSEDKRGEHFFSNNYCPIIDSDGKVGSVVIYAADITERHNYQLRLERLLAEQKALLENDLIGIVTVNDRKIIWANPAFEKMLGYDKGELADTPTRQTYPSEDAFQSFGATAYPILSAGHVFRSQIEQVRKDGKHIWVDLSGAILNPETGESLWGFVDITERKSAETALRESHQELHTLLNSMAEGAYGVDISGHCTFVNDSFLRILGYSNQDEVIGQHIHELIHYAHEDGTPYPASECRMYAAYLQNENIHCTDEVFWHKFGVPIHVEYWSRPITVDGVTMGAVATFVDISERKLVEERMRHLATYDALTDLPNRTLLEDRLRQALLAAKRDTLHIGLMFIDLDKFKPINDAYGHGVGDQVLLEAAKRMQACVRASDTVARIGGDEFIVLLPLVDAKVDVLLVAEKIRYALSQSMMLAGLELNISSSIGIALFPEHGDDEVTLLKHADAAMYEAKQAGRDNVHMFSPNHPTYQF
jgi:diguanylate cyclase (GGDEF)-like protein/PAS domain S-box-containing protein